MTEIIYMAGGILGLFMLVMLMAAVSLWRRGRRQAGTALILLLVLVLAVGGYGISMFRASSQQAAEAQADAYECSTLAQAENSYQEALVLLRSVSLQNADRRTLKAAREDLEAIGGNGHLAEVLDEKYPDVPVLLSYTRLLLAVTDDGDSLNYRDIAQNQALVEAAQEIPQHYSGALAEKILPVREMVLAMKSEGDRQLQQDARDLQQHKENMSQGEYGLVAKGDPESRLVPAFGEPAYVNQPGGEGEPRQYVFNHHSRNIYVYTKNGIVTDVRGM